MKISKKLILLAFGVCLFVATPYAFSQSDSPGQLPAESSITIGENPEGASEDVPTQNTFWVFLRLILVLICTIAAIYGIVYVMKKTFMPKVTENPFLQQITSLPLGANKAIHLIVIDKTAYAVGVSDSAVNLITTIEDKDLVDAMLLHASMNETQNPGWTETLQNLIPALKKTQKTENAASVSAEAALRGMRERFEANNEVGNDEK